MLCIVCKRPIFPSWRYCPQCNAAIPPPQPPSTLPRLANASNAGHVRMTDICQRGSQRPSYRWWGLLGVAVLIVSALILTFRGQQRPVGVKATASEEESRDRLNKLLDPPSAAPLNAAQHLERAKRLLAKIDVSDYETADALIDLVTTHGVEARRDKRTKAQADAVLKQLGDKALLVVETRAWNSPGSRFAAQYVCKQFIERRLKAPSTADWGTVQVGRWDKHPGYFIVDYTVDAQNSFGAKLREIYECRVVCLGSEGACQVKTMYPTR